MKVKKLIELLQKVNPNSELAFCVYTSELHKKVFEIVTISESIVRYSPIYSTENEVKITIENIEENKRFQG